jgi:integrase
MARARLTDKTIQAMKAPTTGRLELYDTIRTGLSIRMTPNGVQTFTVSYRFNGDKRRDTIGTYPKIALGKARELAGQAIEQVDSGVDPRSVAAAQEAEESAKAGNTVEVVTTKFIEKHATKKRWGELERVLKVDVVPAWGERPVVEITRRDVRDLLETIERRAPIQANRTLTILRIFFRWAAKNDYVEGDPTVGIDKTPEVPRDRNLSDDEVRAFWIGCDKIGKPFGPLFQLLLLTAARKSEIAEARWQELDQNKKMLTIPAARMKNKQAHTIPLSKRAWAMVQELDKVGEVPDLMFTTNAKTPVSGFSKLKARLDMHMLAELRKDQEDPDKIKLAPWRIHDLRRVVRSRLSKLGVSSDVAERVLAHAIGGIRRVYDVHDFLEEKRSALERWSKHLAGIVAATPGTVVPMKRGAKR